MGQQSPATHQQQNNHQQLSPEQSNNTVTGEIHRNASPTNVRNNNEQEQQNRTPNE